MSNNHPSNQATDASARRLSNQPIIIEGPDAYNLVNAALPRLPYCDENNYDTITPGFIAAKTLFDDWLDNGAVPKSLQPGHAAQITRAISVHGSTNQFQPCRIAADALRLCYHMRSRGCDTYARIDTHTCEMSLWIVHPDMPGQSVYDVAYWTQGWNSRDIDILEPIMTWAMVEDLNTARHREPDALLRPMPFRYRFCEGWLHVDRISL